MHGEQATQRPAHLQLLTTLLHKVTIHVAEPLFGVTT